MTPIEQAASVLLARSAGSTHLLAVRRAEALRFFGGFFAFPGGKVAADDATVAQAHGLSVAHVCAVRELFEETGVLLARQRDGSCPPSSPLLTEKRRELVADRITFAELLAKLGLSLHESDLIPVGHVTTPSFAPVRFQSTFFAAHLPVGQEAEIWPGELDEGRWISAGDMLVCWERGECLISPPSVVALQALRGRRVDEAPARLGPVLRSIAGGAIHPIFYAPEVQMIPLFTEPLPPSTHTNAYLVGREPAYLIDPGTEDAAEQQRLFALLDDELSRGRRLRAIVLTHHHPDHVGAVNACAARYGVPVWAHPLTQRDLHGQIEVAKLIEDGERLDLGGAPDGNGHWFLEAAHTPGHAPGHLVFYERRYGLLFTGDMVSTITSIVICPPEGDLTQYLESLRRMREYESRLLLPAHGNASARPGKVIDDCLAHRAKREEMLRQVLQSAPRTIPDLTLELYRGLPQHLIQWAELQVLAGLEKLQREGDAAMTAEGWRSTSARI